jgi:hypothetical protein
LRAINLFFCLSLILVFSSCEDLKVSLFKEKTENLVNEAVVVARANDKFLYLHDLEGLTPKGTPVNDSIDIVNRYVKRWVKKNLLINEATRNIAFDEAEIERKILDYRYALMIYEFEKFYINQKLKQEVTEQDIKNYYNENKQNFELKQNIIRGIFVKLPKEAPKMNKFKKLLSPQNDEEWEELKSYCFRFAVTYFLEEQQWLNFDDVVKNTPLMNIPNKVQFLKDNNKKFVETSDENYLYFLKIYEYKISDQISPLEFVSDQIKHIILNKRKLDLSKQLEEEIYKRAEKNNDFEIFSKNN